MFKKTPSLENHLLIASGVMAASLVAVVNCGNVSVWPNVLPYIAFVVLFVVISYDDELGLNPRVPRLGVLAMLALQYAGCLGLVLSGRTHWVLLIVLVNIPVLRKVMEAFRSDKPHDCPEGFPDNIWPLWFSAFAFDHTRRFTTLFIAALLVGQFLA